MTAEPEADAAFEQRLLAWLQHDAGVPDARRVSRLDEETVLISKTEPGLATELHELMEQLPELVSERAVLAAYAREALQAAPGTTRLEVWDRALRELLRTSAEKRGIADAVQQAQVRVGIDSVRAVMESVLWTNPRVDDAEYAPAAAERAAYLDAMRRLAGHDFFTRYYGAFEGRAVLNHCPGAAYARVMAAQAWLACTGEPPPTPDR
jgi:hypothetical protein